MVNTAPEPPPSSIPEPETLPVLASGPLPAQGQPTAPEPAATASRRRSRKTQILLLVLIVLGGLAISGGVAAVVLYDQATKIDRSTPVISTDAFLNAAVVEANEPVSGLYTCGRWPGAEAYAQVRGMLDPQARTSWDSFDVVSQSIDMASIEVRMRILYPGDIGPSGEEIWRFSVVEEDGWRVCSVEKAK